MAQPKFSTMTAEVEEAIPTAAGTPPRSLPSRATSLLARADSEPLPTAQPTSAAARAGASLTPSPTMTTWWSSACMACNACSFCAGLNALRATSMCRGRRPPPRDGGGGVAAQDGGLEAPCGAREAMAGSACRHGAAWPRR